mmetsp:Transcript_13981/g.20923  ORF Transcript_13981/g.20923 Transcript_13981/m.20923 type:complete len:715 (-) Transcript_13981:269-2413(-)
MFPGLSDLSPLRAVELHRRRLSTPSWVDFIVILTLCLIMFYLLRVLMNMSKAWTKKMMKRIKDAMKERAMMSDNFRALNGYSWDYVLVFKVFKKGDKLSPKQKEFTFKKILSAFADGGLETKVFYSAQADEVYMKVRAPLHRLEKEADRIDMKLKLDSDTLRALCKAGRCRGQEELWGPVDIPDTCVETDLDPYDYMYARYCYKRDDMSGLYLQRDSKSPFRGVDRLKLLYSIMVAKSYEGGCNVDIYKLIKDKCLLGFFPLHDHVELRTLEEKWLRFCALPWNQPVDDIKDYFGEKIGLYFVWLGHYTSWLLVAAIVGFFCWINVASEDNDPNAVIMPYFAAFMAFWSTLFLEYWKRKESTTAMKWGTTGYEAQEQSRPQFEGTRQLSPITGKFYLYFPYSAKMRRVAHSVVIISGFVLVVVAAVASIFVLKLTLTHMNEMTQGGIGFGGIVASIANAVVIQVMNAIYGEVAINLTNFENHRTDTEYEDALISKTFIFQFVNSYAPLFYIAFVKPFIPTIDSCIGSCLGELQTNLGTIFLTRLAVGNITEVALPAFQSKQSLKAQGAGSDIEMSEVEKAFYQKEYHVMLGTFEDYAEMVIQFGYTTMFVAAFPLATVMSFVNNYIEIRVDAWKLCQVCRRPEPRSAEDIGTWQTILEVMTLFSVLTNSALVAFTGTFAVDEPWVGRVWIFFLYGCRHHHGEFLYWFGCSRYPH